MDLNYACTKKSKFGHLRHWNFLETIFFQTEIGITWQQNHPRENKIILIFNFGAVPNSRTTKIEEIANTFVYFRKKINFKIS